MSRLRPVIVAIVLVGLTVAGGFAVAARGEGEAEVPARAAATPTATPEATPEPEPTPRPRPKLVEPEAGVSLEAAEDMAEAPEVDPGLVEDDESATPKPTRPASGRTKRPRAGSLVSANADDPRKATALPNGVALPPLEAPEQVIEIIRAGNVIARSPYKWGGGHGNFKDNGYDCSGSVTFALYSAGLIGGSATSGQLMKWGKPGKGKWITIYTNPGHVFMEVAGIRFDTSGARRTGSRWQEERRSTAGYVARHPPGL